MLAIVFLSFISHTKVMKLIRDFDFTKEDFFDYFIKQVSKEIAKSRNNNKPIQITTGTRYTALAKGGQSVKVEVLAYEPNHYFKARYENIEYTVIISYATIDNKSGCEITMEEDIITYDPKSHGKITNFITRLGFYRNMQIQLNKMAKDISLSI